MHRRLLLSFALEMVRGRYLEQAQTLLRAVRRALLSDAVLLLSAWRQFYESELVPRVQDNVARLFGGGALKLQPLPPCA